jgi:hypothetical protein
MENRFRLPALALVAALCLGSLASPAQTPAARPPAASAPAAEAEPVQIVRDPALYVGEIALTSTAPGERRNAIARALVQVVVKLTGNPASGGHTVIRRALAEAEALTTEVHTRSEAETVAGIQTYRQVLVASFNPDAVDALIAAAGQRYWTGNRPKPILWLVIDDGRGPRLVTGQQLSVIKPLARRGLERGMRFLLPAGNSLETAAVQSIWSQNSAALETLTSRYGNDAQMLGRVYRAGGGWNADWILSQGGVELARWSVNDADPQRAIASGADGAADAIATRDARWLNVGAAGSFAASIDGVRTRDDYLRAIGYLEGLALVQSVQVTEATAETLTLQLNLAVGRRGLSTLVNGGSVLRLEPAIEGDETLRLTLLVP